jgi:nucleoside-diphosphate-sugar epimerase
MKILVTGGMGFIGHNVVASLDKLGHDVVVIDSHTGYGIIPSKELKYIHNERIKKFTKNVKIHKVDICDDLESIFKKHKFELVIHLASFPRQKVVNLNPILGSKVMSEGLINLLETSKNFNIKKFVYISSSMVYGDWNDKTPIKETTNCNPIGQYGILKLSGEKLVKDYGRRNCFSYNIIRPSAVYGPMDVEDRVVSKFIINAICNKTLIVNGQDEMLDFTYIDDAVEGIVNCSLSENTNNRTYNISRGFAYSLLNAAQIALKTANGGMLQVSDRDTNFPVRGTLDTTQAEFDFGYNPTIDVEKGFKNYYDWLISSIYYTK